jgi:DNA adenine methylase
VLLAKTPSPHETVNDLHGDLVNLARVLQHETAAPALYGHLQRALVSEDLLKQARKYLERPIKLSEEIHSSQMERAYWYFLASWMGRNGVSGMDRIEYQLAVRWTAGGGTPTKRWLSAIESIPAWHRRLQNVVILNRDALTFIDRFEDKPHTAIYVDPPYVRGSREHGNYKHDFDAGSPMFGDAHGQLVDLLNGYKHARIVVSYYDCPRIRELYAGWTFIDCTMNKNLHAQNGRGARKKEAPEVLIVNQGGSPS